MEARLAFNCETRVLVKDNPDGTLIKVRDFGIGISKEEQVKIFNGFTAPGCIPKSAAWVSLYISLLIANRHGAKLWVKSRAVRGSTFFLQLPSQKPDRG